MRTAEDGFSYRQVLALITDVPTDATELTVMLFGEDYTPKQRRRMTAALSKLGKDGIIVKDNYRFRHRPGGGNAWVPRWRLPTQREIERRARQ